MGCRLSPLANPSMLVTCASWHIAANVKHELMRRPFTKTVQAPHCPWSQPFLVPVICRFSLSRSSSEVLGSIVNVLFWPLTIKLTDEISTFGGGWSGTSAALEISGARVSPAPATAICVKNPRRVVPLVDGTLSGLFKFGSSLPMIYRLWGNNISQKQNV